MLHCSRPWPVRGTAGGKEMGEPRKPSGPLPGSRRPPTEGHISCKERPQRNRQGAGDACPHYRRSGGERHKMGEGHAVDDSGLGPTKMPNFPNGDLGDGGGSGPLLAAASLHKKCPNHPSSMQQALRAAARCARPSRSSPTHMECRVCLENKETTRDWCSDTLVRAGGGARDACRQKTLHTMPSGTRGGGAAPGLGGPNGENLRKAQGAGRGSGKGARATGGHHTGASQGSRGKDRNQARRRKSTFGRHKKIAELARKDLKILGARATQTGRRRVVLQEVEGGPFVCVWATKGLERILDNQAGAFASQPNQYGCLIQWLPNRESKLQIHVQEPKTFWNNEGTRIAWNPISLLAIPKAEDLQDLQRLLEDEENRRMVLEAEEMEEPPRLRFWPAPPPNKHCKKALELPEGEYLVTRFAEETFRGTLRTYLFLATMGEDGHQNTDEEMPTFGPCTADWAEREPPERTRNATQRSY